MQYILIMPANKKTDFIISTMIKLLSLQIPSLTVKKIEYSIINEGKKFDLNQISSPKIPETLCYTRMNNDIYAFGEKNAVSSFY